MTQHEQDGRDIRTVILEKAMLGYVPTGFRVLGDDRLHPVDWKRHPHLVEVVFSDKTTSHVDQTKTNTIDESLVGKVPVNDVITHMQGEHVETHTEPSMMEILSQINATTED